LLAFQGRAFHETSISDAERLLARTLVGARPGSVVNVNNDLVMLGFDEPSKREQQNCFKTTPYIKTIEGGK